MRESVVTTDFTTQEVSPLIPDPPVHSIPRVKQRSNCCHECWSRFTCCSKWTCIFITVLVLIAILIVVRTLLPFGWPWWVPDITYDPSDPHIIVIVADDIGWGDLGYGGAEYPTTNIDQLRQQGISLNRMYVHQSGSGTRASLLTGIPGYALGLQHGVSTGSSAHIPLDVQLLPEILRDQRGYATHMVGKWGLGYSKWAYTPTHRGFDTFLGFHQRYIDYWHYSASVQTTNDNDDDDYDLIDDTSSLSRKHKLLMGYDLWHNTDIYTPSNRMQYATELFDDRVSEILDNHANSDTSDRPMFLYYTPPNAHAPIQYHYEYEGECSYIRDTSETIRWKYCNLMQELDASIGSLVDKLKEHDMWDRSLILFTTDNGGLMCYDVGNINGCSGSVNLPLRGGKGTLFEGSIRVRSMLSGGYLDENLRGESSDALMHAADMFTTLLGAAHVDAQAVIEGSSWPRVEGLSFWQFLRGKTDPPEREVPFIADMSVDETGSYIEKAALFWKGFKYIIQPMELYDGWWRSPLSGTEEIPVDSAGVKMEPQPLQQKSESDVTAHVKSKSKQNNQHRFELEEEDVQWDTLRMNEYLFNIEEDPAETQNVRMETSNEAVLQELREYLQSLGGTARLYTSQDSSTQAMSDPNRFNNVWYPFEE